MQSTELKEAKWYANTYVFDVYIKFKMNIFSFYILYYLINKHVLLFFLKKIIVVCFICEGWFTIKTTLSKDITIL